MSPKISLPSDSATLVVRKSVLSGAVRVGGAKNSALRLLAASLLTDEEIIIQNFPCCLLDVKIHIEMLRKLGKECSLDGAVVIIKREGAIKSELIWEGRSIRNTLLIFGALLARRGKARVPLPGGCAIGERKYDLHKMILEKMGASVKEEDAYLVGKAPAGLHGAEIYLPIRSTGATENGIISACLAKGRTVIWGPHIRPEIVDLVGFLNSMGAHIEIRGQESIIIEGVDKLSGTKHTVIPDNLEAITYLIGAVITGGDVEILDFPYSALEIPLIHLRESGTRYYQSSDSLIIRGGQCYPVEISTGPYPGINSDMQPLFAVYGLCAKGESRITDLRFPDRFGYSEELRKMGGSLDIRNNMLIVSGGKKLTGTNVTALDLRCGAALLLAGFVSEGQTIIRNAQQISRGYEDIAAKFQSLNGDISWSDNTWNA